MFQKILTRCRRYAETLIKSSQELIKTAASVIYRQGRRTYLFYKNMTLIRRRIATIVFISLLAILCPLLPAMFYRPFIDSSYTTIVEDRNGEILSLLIASDEQWRFPPFSEKSKIKETSGEKYQLPEKYKKALLTFEDKRFFFHPGVDLIAILRAIKENLKAKQVMSGASTITMQVIRLSLPPGRRTLPRKIYEAYLALALEIRLSKKEILALYTTHAPMGGNIVGLEAAGYFYFGVTPDNLSWAEAALLAVLPNSPGLLYPTKDSNYYDDGYNYEYDSLEANDQDIISEDDKNEEKEWRKGREAILKKKRDGLLTNLYQEGILDETDWRLSMDEPLAEKINNPPREAQHLLVSLTNTKGKGQRYQTSLNGSIQRKASEQTERWHTILSEEGIHNIAAVILSTETLEVLAYVGNAGDDPSRQSGVDNVISQRSTGSTLKPFLYAGALDSGIILPKMILNDTPVNFGGFHPENFSGKYNGVVPADEALTRSLNVPFACLLQQFTVLRFHKLLKEIGLDLPNNANHYGLTLIIGGAETSLLNLAGLYAGMGNSVLSPEESGYGFLPPTILKQEASDRREHFIQKKGDFKKSNSPISKGSLYITLKALLGVIRPKAYQRDAEEWEKNISWKTGTSYGSRDGWAVGVSPQYTVAVWAGNSNGEGRKGLTGSRSAAPLMFSLFNLLERYNYNQNGESQQDSKPFLPPWNQLEYIPVSVDSGYPPSRYTEKIRDELVPKVERIVVPDPYSIPVFLDETKTFSVNANSYPSSKIVRQVRFILPPIQESYYRLGDDNYLGRPLTINEKGDTKGNISILYPRGREEITPSINVDGVKNEILLEAVHRNPEEKVFWHLNQKLIGTTEGSLLNPYHHKLSVSLAPGDYILTVVDGEGNRSNSTFIVTK